MIYGIYFSPTSNSKRVVEAMLEGLNEPSHSIDITVSLESNLSFDQDDFIIIGAPVYGGRIPGIAFERLLRITGNNTPCVLLATYGNRHYDNALSEMANLMTKNGFVIYGAAAMIGRHTYGEIQVNRPDKDDYQDAVSFIMNVYHRKQPIVSKLVGETYPEPAKNKGRFHPLTDATCIKCGLCAKNCPVQAISSDCSTISNDCISCFRCLRNCPIQAKNMNTDEYNNFATMFTEKLKERRENEFFL